LGQILEKSQSYKDAAEKYENAWRYTNEASPSVGYRLAFTYLKAKRLTEAIDVCHKVRSTACRRQLVWTRRIGLILKQKAFRTHRVQTEYGNH
jgi:predicted Zn-dependent protease